MSVVARTPWPLVAARALRTLGVLLAAAVLIRLACVPRSRGGSGQRAYAATARALLWSLRVDLRTEPAARSTPGPALIVANHVSWLDILVLAASEPMVPVAKAEIGRWAVIGPVARGLGAVFIDRDRLTALPQTVTAMAAALRAGRCVQVFPEATTRCGTAVDPFRRAAFQAAIDAGVPVRPVALAYRDGTGRPTTAPAFVGDQTLFGSVITLLRGGPVVASLSWAEPIAAASVVVPGLSGAAAAAVARAGLARSAELAVARSLGQPVLTRPRRLTTAAPQAPWTLPAA